MVTRLRLAGPPRKLLQPPFEADKRPETMTRVHAAPLVAVDELLDGGALKVRARGGRRSEQRIANVVAQLASEPGIERNAEPRFRTAVDVLGNQIREGVPKDRLGPPAIELQSVRQPRRVRGER